MKQDFCFKDKSQIAHQILAYLTDHPEAQDTLDGIMEWWLLERRIEEQVSIVKRVLAGLVRKGLVLEYKKRDGRTHYRINQRKPGEIQAFLKQRSGRMCHGLARNHERRD